MVQFINSKFYYADLLKASQENNNKPIPLNIFEISPEDDMESIASMALVFKKESYLCVCSQLRFFSDPQGVNTIFQKVTQKDKKSNLGPYLFKGS